MDVNTCFVDTCFFLSAVPGLNVISGLIGAIYHLAQYIINRYCPSGTTIRGKQFQKIQQKLWNGVLISLSQAIPFIGNIITYVALCYCCRSKCSGNT